MFDPCLDSNLFDTAVVLIAVFALSAHMRISLTAPTVRKRETKLMGSHGNVLHIYHSFPGYELCQQTLRMQKRCGIEQTVFMNPVLSGMFSIPAITRLYSTPSFPTRILLFTFSLMLVTLPLVFQPMGLLPSSGVIRHAGP